MNLPTPSSSSSPPHPPSSKGSPASCGSTEEQEQQRHGGVVLGGGTLSWRGVSDGTARQGGASTIHIHTPPSQPRGEAAPALAACGSASCGVAAVMCMEGVLGALQASSSSSSSSRTEAQLPRLVGFAIAEATIKEQAAATAAQALASEPWSPCGWCLRVVLQSRTPDIAFLFRLVTNHHQEPPPAAAAGSGTASPSYVAPVPPLEATDQAQTMVGGVEVLVPPSLPGVSSLQALGKQLSGPLKTEKAKAPPAAGSPPATTEKEGAKENTGRWTCEEHVLFLKGLEMHGKGWKKIAKLIKTRTVVQIRTHAQKYFQKLAKAKKTGQHGDLLMESSRFGKKGGRRRGVFYGGYYVGLEGGAALSRALKPFVPANPSEDDIEKGLYRFLSPVIIDPDVQGIDACDPEIVPQSPPVDGSSTDGEGQQNGEAAVPVLARITSDMYQRCGVPEWFRKGGELEELLTEAAVLDWVADNGGEAYTGTLTIAAPPNTRQGANSSQQQQNGGASEQPPQQQRSSGSRRGGSSANHQQQQQAANNNNHNNNNHRSGSSSSSGQQQQNSSSSSHTPFLQDSDLTTFDLDFSQVLGGQGGHHIKDDPLGLDMDIDMGFASASSSEGNTPTGSTAGSTAGSPNASGGHGGSNCHGHHHHHGGGNYDGLLHDMEDSLLLLDDLESAGLQF